MTRRVLSVQGLSFTEGVRATMYKGVSFEYTVVCWMLNRLSLLGTSLHSRFYTLSRSLLRTPCLFSAPKIVPRRYVPQRTHANSTEFYALALLWAALPRGPGRNPFAERRLQ